MKEKTQTTTAVTVAQSQGEPANMIPVKDFEDISRLGIAVAKSGWFGAITQSTGEMIALTMIDEKIGPTKFKKKYHVMVNKKTGECTLTIAARSTVSSFKRLGGKMKLHEVSKDKCDITFIYDGNELRHCVTLQEFIDNGVAISSTGALKDSWAKFSGDMLYARCCSFAIRKVCPEADDGLYTTEEVADFDDAPAAPREPVKIDKADVVSRLAKDTPAEPKPAPAAAQAQKPMAHETIDVEIVDEPRLESTAQSVVNNPFDTPQQPHLETHVCPIEGPFFNVPFSQMEPDILQFLLLPDTAKNHPELTEEHIAAAKEAARAKGLEV